MPSYGHKASQFVDLLGYFTINTPQLLEKVGMHYPHSRVVSTYVASSEEMVVIAAAVHCHSFCRMRKAFL